MLSSCLLLFLSLPKILIPQVTFPLIQFHIIGMAVDIELDIPSLTISETSLTIGRNSTSLKLLQDINLRAALQIKVGLLEDRIEVDFVIGEGSQLGYETGLGDSCEVLYANPICKLIHKELRIVKSEKGIIDEILSIFSTEMISNAICYPILTEIADLFDTPRSKEPLPPNPTGNLVINTSQLIVAALKVANTIPTVAGINFNASTVSDNAVFLQVSLEKDINYQSNALDAHFPDLLNLSTDLVLEGNCTPWYSDYAACNLSSIVPFNTFIEGGGIITSILNSSLSAPANFLIGLFVVSYFDKGIQIGFDTFENNQNPNWRIFGPLIGFFAIIVPVIWFLFSYRRIIREGGATLTKNAKWLLWIDLVLLFAIAINILLFVWVNMTPPATLVVGNTMTISSFAIGQSVPVMWRSGMKFAAIIIVLFSGVYPYIKLVLLGFFTVILRIPDSRIIQGIDLLGKLSLVDPFMMLQVASSLSLEGVAELVIHRTMSVFLFAILLSLIIGNCCTGFIARKHQAYRLEMKPKVKDLSQTFTIEDSYKAYDKDSEPMDEKNSSFNSATDLVVKRRRFWDTTFVRPFFMSIPFFIVSLACSIITLLIPTFEYKLSGLSMFILGKQISVTILDMCKKTTWTLAFALIATVIVVPVLHALSFPYFTHLSSWFATDAFVLSALAAITQAETFISSTLPPVFKLLIDVKSKLLWPLYFMCISIAVSVILTIRYVIRL